MTSNRPTIWMWQWNKMIAPHTISYWDGCRKCDNGKRRRSEIQACKMQYRTAGIMQNLQTARVEWENDKVGQYQAMPSVLWQLSLCTWPIYNTKYLRVTQLLYTVIMVINALSICNQRVRTAGNIRNLKCNKVGSDHGDGSAKTITCKL